MHTRIFSTLKQPKSVAPDYCWELIRWGWCETNTGREHGYSLDQTMPYKNVEVTNVVSVAAATRWWEELASAAAKGWY